MKVILHIGAHRTATTSLQSYIRRHAVELRGDGVGFWGPVRTRKGLFAGIQPTPGLGLAAARRARGRILLQMKKAQNNGVKTLVVSEENMIGSVRLNLRKGRLYPDVGERMSRYICAFDQRVDKVVISVRGLDHYWASAIAYGVGRGHPLLDADRCAAISQHMRTWRDVIADVSCAAPLAQIEVIPFEVSAGRPDLMLSACTGHVAPRDATPEWLNRSPNARQLRALLAERGEDPRDVPNTPDRWSPFDATGRAALRESYADDMHWLVAGADGLATLTEELDQTRAGKTPPHGPHHRGQGHDIEERRMAQPR
ncbi:hypothetical protein [uncultured Tateyamaria sp.]|uniref:hypothetical protein n=1 Tax=uncultured Tateyamaria sp. TaxID=455651 RepID=UPI00262D154C|nr:hypothetical protein [uncultured Tateyamaria sp.]